MITRRNFLTSLPFTAALPAILHASGVSPGRPHVACQANAWEIKAGDFDDLLKRAAEMKRIGYEAFECNFRYVEGQFASAAKARARIEQTGMTFYGGHTGLQQSAESLDRCVDGSAALGAKHFALSGAGGGVTKDGRLVEDALAKKVEAITRLAKRCQQAGVRLAYHNHGSEFTGGGLEIEELLRRTDPALVFMLFDLGHAHREDADVVAFFAKHHARIDAMHVRDIHGTEQVPIGKGEVNLTGLAEVIRMTQWSGWLTNEEENLSKTIEASAIEPRLQADRDAIRRIFGV
jgi:sugar phosphate isomerase/epimerase